MTRRLNFPIEDTLYRGLVPVNVNDSVLQRDCRPLNKRAMHKKYLQRMRNKTRDPESDLNDFLAEIRLLAEPQSRFRVDTTVDWSLLPELPRGNLTNATEIFLKLGVHD